MNITIKDVAKKVGVTPTTVSMALKNDPRISDATKNRVLEAVKDLNYYPNHIGQSLVKGRTDTIAVVSNLFFAWFKMDLLNGIGKSIFETKYRMNQYSTREGIESETLKEILYGRRADAVINISFRPDKPVLEEFRKMNRPIVLIEDVVEGFAGVKVDNFKGAYMATGHLLNAGRKNIGILSGRVAEGKGGLNVLERVDGYKHALDDNGVDLRKRFMVETETYSFEEAKKAFDRFMENKKGIDAIFCAAGDVSAMGLMKRAQETGVKVPDDVAIIGYDDIIMSSVVSPALTTVRQPVFEMGQAAVRMTVEQLETEGKCACEVVNFQPELIIRDSA